MARRRKGKAGQRRVDFRPNRQQPRRHKHFGSHHLADEAVEDVHLAESVRAKGELSRRRTVVERLDEPLDGRRMRGKAVAVRGAYVEVDDGKELWLCTIRRILRTRSIDTRSPVVVGDDVIFAVTRSEGAQREGVIEEIAPRRSTLARSDGRRTHVIAANVDQAVIVSSIREPRIKEHLIDRYLVAAHAGNIRGIVCINKADLDEDDEIPEILERYTRIGYLAGATSTKTGQGIRELRDALAGKVTIISGQSGVGKSSLLNAINPAWNLKTAAVSEATEKGRHTTTTAVWLKLPEGGAVVDTPGIRALDVAMVPLEELEMHFVEFVDRVRHCRFPNCIHIHEEGCAIKAAVEAGEIDPMRYESYVELFMELSELRAKRMGN
ncbi:MAG TPA: ribosome small subunit-dependent GTPase A [Phycisphaerae bacterium]|nr:ribosome small subunit-dependent GTPase A [Phycisphaerae bacterium]HOB75594.1 ribosome small subunit-dependent GTPase A [Phycisphaerae bacterium]HOJ55136.1 ribosome small subunit-dependent GTPase A [Phycisphaerae bacterium]HOL27338.1 ribosome small subunit-dependent GTPase A [Phycisphaerae bacterium]HPP20722.1 ribosome small subunit-dependent GTPase A [Phycisphaerae bacterium]